MKFKSIIYLILLVLSSNPIMAEKAINEKSKSYSKAFTVNANSEVKLRNRRGNIHIENIEGTEGRIEVILKVRGKEDEEIEKVFSQYELALSENESRVDITGEDNIKNWSIVNSFFKNSNKMKFNSGVVAHGIEEVQAEMTIYIPKIAKLNVENKYHDINFTQLPCDLEVNLYSGKLKGQDIQGDFNLDMKYGKVDIGSFQNAKIDIYDSEYISKNGAKVDFRSKYSEIEIGDLASLDFSSYDDNVELGSIEKEIEFEAKYTNLEMGSFETADWDIYDTDVDAKNGKSLTLKSKYGKMEFEAISQAKISSYDDAMDFKSLKNLRIKESKYTEYDIDNFEGYMNIDYTYEDKILISQVINEFDGLSIAGKYTTLDFPLKSSIAYALDAKTKYGNFEYAPSFTRNYKDKDGESLELKGFANGGNDSDPKVTVDTYDCKIDLNN